MTKNASSVSKRFTDTELWDKEWFMKLPTKLKCLVKFVRDKCDLAGVWSPNWAIANAYIGEQVAEKDLLDIDHGNQFKKLNNGKINCIDFVRFQYGTLSEKSPVHRKVMSILSTHQIPIKYPILRVKEKEEVEDEEEVKEEEPYFFYKSSTELLDAWKGFDEMRTKNKKPLTPIAIKKLDNKLVMLSGGKPELGVQIIDQSTIHCWASFFQLKQENQSSEHKPKYKVL